MTGTPLFHVAIEDDWEAAQVFGWYEASTRGRSLSDEGFIHAVTAELLPAVLNHYADLDLQLLLVVLDEAALVQNGVPVEWDAKDRNSARLMAAIPVSSPGAVVAVVPLIREGDHWLAPGERILSP